MKGHYGTTLNVAELIAPGRRVAVGGEELSYGVAILREIRVIAALIPLLIEVEYVIGGGLE